MKTKKKVSQQATLMNILDEWVFKYGEGLKNLIY